MTQPAHLLEIPTRLCASCNQLSMGKKQFPGNSVSADRPKAVCAARGLSRTADFTRLLLLLILLLSLPMALQAQFNYTTNGGEITITGYTGEGGAVAIPDIIDGLPVTCIGDWAFEYCGSLTNITLGNHVAKLGDWAFYGCYNLTSCVIPNNVTSIGFNCFSSCIRLTNFVISSGLTNIEAPVVSGCSRLRAITVDAFNPSYCSIDGVLFNKSLTTLVECPPLLMMPCTIPDSVTTIGSSAFAGCGSMTSITIPDSVNIIGGSVFADCANLTNVFIGNGVTNIAYSAFSGCWSLKSIIIPDSVSKIGAGIFKDCISLTTVIFGKNVRFAATPMFSGCTRLASVYFKGNAPFVDPHMFDHLYYVTVYYLPGTTGWSSGFAGRPAKLWNPHPLTTDASFGMRTNQFGFTIAGTTGITFVVEACTNLANPTWFPVQTNTLYGDTADFSDPAWTNSPSRFYRFRAP